MPVDQDSHNCGVRAHSVKAKGFEEDRLYVTTPSVRGKQTVYLSPSLELTEISEDIISLLLSIERSVAV